MFASNYQFSKETETDRGISLSLAEDSLPQTSRLRTPRGQSWMWNSRTGRIVYGRKVRKWFPLVRWGQEWTGKGDSGLLECDNVLCCHRDLGYIGEHVRQTFSRVHLEFVHVILCKFLLQKTQTVNKYWTLISDMLAELFSGKCIIYFESIKN